MKFNTGLPKPDMTLYLEGAFSLFSQRDGNGSERYETEEFQAKVKNIFELLKVNDPSWITINVNGKNHRRCQIPHCAPGNILVHFLAHIY